MNTTHKVCIVIVGPSFEEALSQIEKGRSYANLFEFRLDLFDSWTKDSIQTLQRAAQRSVIFSLRKHSHGGAYTGSEESRLQSIRELATLEPQCFDLECDTDPGFFHNIKAEHPAMQLISSYHNFTETPHDLDSTFKQVQAQPADLYKVATMAHSALDALRMLRFVKNNGRPGNIVGMCLGEDGIATRILGKSIGNALTYAAVDKASTSAPGQLDVNTLFGVYNFDLIGPATRIYGLIGNPVEQSISHVAHNKTMREQDLDAIYIKFRVEPRELCDFLAIAKELGVRGLSVTIPLKEEVVKYVKTSFGIAAEAKAINTLLFSDEEILGYNTDGDAAAELIGERISLQKKRVVIIGAGGSAKAIACALKRAGADVTILNRTAEKAVLFADQMGFEGYALGRFKEITSKGYDVLINCTSVGMGMDAESIVKGEEMLPKRVVMDIVAKPRETALLRAAKEIGCVVIDGEELFYKQGTKQFLIWFGRRGEGE